MADQQQKRYPELRPWDLEPEYIQNVAAMTAEGLHSKTDIAMQLAWRDQTITRLRSELAAKEARVGELEDMICASAPLAWAASGDMEDAGAWERQATELLEKKP